MRPPLQITSTENPRVKRIAQLRKQRERRKGGQFIAEGFREVGRALEAGLALQELFWSPQQTGLSLETLLQRLPALAHGNPLLMEVTPALLKKMTYLDEPEGVLAVFEQPLWSLQTLPAPSAQGTPLYLVANGTNKPGNLGAMARTAAAAGATALLTADAEVDAFNPNAIRASTGAVFTLPILSAPSAKLIRFLQAQHITIAAATPEASILYSQANLAGPLAVVIGAEDTGLTSPWRAAADLRLTIPMSGGLVDSLNASAAAAILLFEALRQRHSAREDGK
jgi:TrmH family RNA methyltransferase